MNLAINKVTRTIAANQVQTVSAAGTFVQFVSSTGAFRFSIDGGPYVDGFTVLSIPLPPLATGAPPTPFREILLQDASGSTNTITIIVANGPVQYNPAVPTSVTQNASTSAVGTGLKTLADAGSSAAYTGVSATGTARKHFICSNLNASGGTLIYVSDGTNLGVPVQGAQTVILETSASLKVVNTTGSGASNYMVMEIFY